MTHSTETLARYVIHWFHERGDLLTNLKLQKLLYYIQGWHLALHETPLFLEDFQAWVHGPVLPSIYQKYKKYTWNPISEDVKNPLVDSALQAHADEVLDVYGMDTAWALEKRTHLESPWKEARGNLPFEAESTAIITQASMKAFFKSCLNESCS